jgi:hypothetical protein
VRVRSLHDFGRGEDDGHTPQTLVLFRYANQLYFLNSQAPLHPFSKSSQKPQQRICNKKLDEGPFLLRPKTGTEQRF